MFHEVAYPWQLFDRPTRWLLAAGQRWMARTLLKAGTHVDVTTPAWERMLRAVAPGRLGAVGWRPVPSNIPVAQGPGIPAHFTTNYDRTIRPCYDIGEYMAATNLGDGVIAAWGDNRNPWTSPPDSPAAGTHPQPDVFAKTANSD